MIGVVFYKAISVLPILCLSYKYFWGYWFHTVTWEWSKCWYSNLGVNIFENVWLSPHRNILSWRKRIIWELHTLQGLLICSFPSNVSETWFFRQLLRKTNKQTKTTNLTTPPLEYLEAKTQKGRMFLQRENWSNVVKNQMLLLLTP